MKVLEVLSKGRRLIDDPDAVDWDNDDLLVWYNDCVVLIRKMRPDTKFAADGSEITYAASTDPTNDDVIFAEPEAWAICVADYIAYRAFMEDEGDKRDMERSMVHWEAFQRSIVNL